MTKKFAVIAALFVLAMGALVGGTAGCSLDVTEPGIQPDSVTEGPNPPGTTSISPGDSPSLP